MEAGELVLKLGVKGSDKTVGAITQVKEGLGEAKHMSLEAKAAIVGAMYALERLFATSGAAGTGLTNFNSLLGVSTQTLQQYQYAARQMGATNEDVAGTFRSLQGAMTKTLMGEGAPKGLARVGMLTGGLTPKDIEDFAKNPEFLMQRLQQYALKEKNVGLRNEVLKSFNLSDSMIAAMSRNAFNPDLLKRAPTYSTKDIGALDKANIAWSNLGQKIEMAFGHFNARHGQQLVHDISQIVTQVVKLAEAFEHLAEKLKIFSLLGKALEGVSNTVETMAIFLGGTEKERKTKANEIYKNLNSQDTRPLYQKWNLFGGAPEMNIAKNPKMITPSLPSNPVNPGTKNVEVNQTLNFQHEGKEHQKTADSVKKSINDFFRQSSAQGQSS